MMAALTNDPTAPPECKVVRTFAAAHTTAALWQILGAEVSAAEKQRSTLTVIAAHLLACTQPWAPFCAEVG